MAPSKVSTMPLRDDFDDEDDLYGNSLPPPPPRPSRQGANSTVIILVVVGCVALVVLLICAGLFLMAFRGAEPPAKPVAASKVAVIQPAGEKERMFRVYTREEFRHLVMGKTPKEVMAAVGRPDNTDDRPDGSPRTWYYWSSVTNPATGRGDKGILDFQDGKVVVVRW